MNYFHKVNHIYSMRELYAETFSDPSGDAYSEEAATMSDEDCDIVDALNEACGLPEEVRAATLNDEIRKDNYESQNSYLRPS